MITIERIRQLLKDANIKAVAQAAGLNPHTVYRLMDENAEPRYSTVKAISDYFDDKGVS